VSFRSDLAGEPSSGYTDKGESSFKPMGAVSNPAAGTSGSDRRSATVAVPWNAGTARPQRTKRCVCHAAVMGSTGEGMPGGNPPHQLIHLWTALATRGSGLDPLEQVAGAGPAFGQNVVVDRDREAVPVRHCRCGPTNPDRARGSSRNRQEPVDDRIFIAISFGMS
jgi:hypothetical protein